MISSLLLVTVLTLVNFLVFITLIIMLLRSRRRYRDSSFRITSAETDLESTQTDLEARHLYEDSEIVQDASSSAPEPEEGGKAVGGGQSRKKDAHQRQEVSVG